jgi:hypothetical protein
MKRSNLFIVDLRKFDRRERCSEQEPKAENENGNLREHGEEQS